MGNSFESKCLNRNKKADVMKNDLSDNQASRAVLIKTARLDIMRLDEIHFPLLQQQ